MDVSALTPADRGIFPGRLFHVGVIVADLDQGMKQWTDMLGVSWRDPFAGFSEVHLADSVAEEPFAAVYSQEGPTFIELIPIRHGSIWGTEGLHHMGYWSDDVRGDSSWLVGTGAALEAMMVRSGQVLAAYLRIGAVRIELNTSSARERLIGNGGTS